MPPTIRRSMRMLKFKGGKERFFNGDRCPESGQWAPSRNHSPAESGSAGLSIYFLVSQRVGTLSDRQAYRQAYWNKKIPVVHIQLSES